MPTKLTSGEELSFQAWYRQLAKKMNIDPNPDDPRHHYDYRGFFKDWLEGKASMVEDESKPSMGIDLESGELHFPSEYKEITHPTYMKQFRPEFMKQMMLSPLANLLKGRRVY